MWYVGTVVRRDGLLSFVEKVVTLFELSIYFLSCSIDSSGFSINCKQLLLCCFITWFSTRLEKILFLAFCCMFIRIGEKKCLVSFLIIRKWCFVSMRIDDIKQIISHLIGQSQQFTYLCQERAGLLSQ